MTELYTVTIGDVVTSVRTAARSVDLEFDVVNMMSLTWVLRSCLTP